MSRVEYSAPLARVRERLAGAAPCPDVCIVGDSSESKSMRPTSDASEEMPLPRAGDVGWDEVGDGSSVDLSRRDEVMVDQIL